MLRTLEEKVNPKHAALLVVDIQNDFCHSEGIIGRQWKDRSLIEKVMPRLLRILSEARQQKLTIIFTRHITSDCTISPVIRERRLRLFPETSEMPCQEGSWGAEFYEVVPQPGECIVAKHRYSAFTDTNLEVILRSMEIKTLIMTGVVTNVCVESTARDGFMKDYYIVFVNDCTASQSIDDHEATLRNIKNYFGVVATSEELMTVWQKMKPH